MAHGVACKAFVNLIALKGITGDVRWSYQRAAEVTSWTIEAGQLTATIVSHDAFRLSQQPLRFVATHAKGAWVWPIQQLQVSGSSLTATLGPME